MVRRSRSTTLSIVLAGDEPPSEFRVFTAGKVDTVKGVFTFDAEAARSVLAEYAAHGIDLMIDYDHASLGADRSPDPAQAGKAAGWFGLAIRGGELWAVNVRWTPPAAEALRKREWRFMSPAFTTDGEGRITSVMNVALTNLPATRRLEPLMAAAARGDSMDPSLVAKALDALVAGDADAAMAILKELITSAAGGEAPDDGATPPDAGADAGQEMSSGAPPPPPKAAPPGGAAPPASSAPPEKKEAVAAALNSIMRTTGATTFTEAAAIVYVTSRELETERQKLAVERATLESAERRKGCVELVTMAGRPPATVWADDSATSPKTYLASMPIDDFRAYVKDAIAAVGGLKKRPTALRGASGGEHGLSADELAICKQQKCDPTVFAQLKAQRDSVKTGGN